MGLSGHRRASRPRAHRAVPRRRRPRDDDGRLPPGVRGRLGGVRPGAPSPLPPGFGGDGRRQPGGPTRTGHARRRHGLPERRGTPVRGGHRRTPARSAPRTARRTAAPHPQRARGRGGRAPRAALRLPRPEDLPSARRSPGGRRGVPCRDRGRPADHVRARMAPDPRRSRDRPACQPLPPPHHGVRAPRLRDRQTRADRPRRRPDLRRG